MLGFLKKKIDLKEDRLNTQIERSESAFRVALEAEQRGNSPTAMHFLDVAVKEESKAFD